MADPHLGRAAYALIQMIEDTGGVWDDPGYLDADMRGALMGVLDEVTCALAKHARSRGSVDDRG